MSGHTSATIVGLPGDGAFADATHVFNLAAPARPAVALVARSVADVQYAVRLAGSLECPLRVHTTGHGAASARPMDGEVLVRTALDGSVDVDPLRRVARIPAGGTWGSVIEAAHSHGLAAPHGSSPLVGVVGYVVKGGVSFYARRVGLAANSVRAVELVTADGELRRVDAECDPALFWALRGGGGGFGIVTAVELDLFPCTRVHTGAAYWSARYADRLLPAWLGWTADAPRDATTTLRVMNLPAHPGIPVELTSGTVVCIDGAVLADGDAERGRRHTEDLLGPLRAIAPPLLDTWRVSSPPAVAQTHMDPTEPFPVYGDHMLLDDLAENAVSELLRVAGPASGSPLTNVELRQLGGALSAPPAPAGALDRLAGDFAYLGGGVPLNHVTREAILERCAMLRAALTPWDTGRTAPSFVEHVGQPQGHLDLESAGRAEAVRRRVDPTGLFRQEVSPGATPVPPAYPQL